MVLVFGKGKEVEGVSTVHKYFVIEGKERFHYNEERKNCSFRINCILLSFP
jgi:hypothetical protein